MGWSTLNPYKDGKQLVFEGNFTEDTVITHGDKTAEDNPLKDFDFDNSSTIDVYPVLPTIQEAVNFTTIRIPPWTNQAMAAL